LRNRDERAIEFASEFAHRGQSIARSETLRLDRFDELIRELNVERPGVGRREAKVERRYLLSNR